MSIDNLPVIGDATPPAVAPQGVPRKPPPGPNVPPQVTILPPTGRVLAGVPAPVSLSLNPGTRWVFQVGDDAWADFPVVTYTTTTLTSDNVTVTGNLVTFPSPGDHVLAASANTNTGGVIQASPVTVHVASPPAFTITAPAAGAVIPLDEASGNVDVQVIFSSAQFFPLKVTIFEPDPMAAGQFRVLATDDNVTSPSYATTVTVNPSALGARAILVTASDRDGLSTTNTVTVTGRDVATPHVSAEPVTVIGNAAGAATASIRGTASDVQSGMIGGQATVAWSLTPTGARTTAVPEQSGDFRDWSADVPLAGFGAHPVYLWGTDQAGNVATTPTVVTVVVISSYPPATLDERLNEREYLAALLSFAQEQVTLPGSPPPQLDTNTLVGALGQRVDLLSQPVSAADDHGAQEINQLRVPVELLRAQIAATQTPTVPGAALETTYRDTAYAVSLASYGTSYTQLRLTRGAPTAERQALAARLGIRLSAKTPDELDQLILEGSRLTEAALETMFGLLDSTGADPLRAPRTPMLLTWQLSAQSLTWAEQDHHPSALQEFTVLADPDVIGASDVAPGPKGDPIRTLLVQRAGQLKSYANSLERARVAAADPAGGLAAMVALALPGVDLADLAAKDAKSIDISAALAAAGLTRGGFVFLVELSRIVTVGAATQFEWADANAVLTAAHKVSLLPGWGTQENAFVLSPDFFVLNDVAPQVNPYRVDGQVRESWQGVLRTRIAQRQDLIDANPRAVAAAEQAALPILRDVLLADLAPTTTGDVGEEMSARFFVDMLAGGALRTSRIGQAIESVQSLLSAKRSGELTPSHPAAPWAIKSPDAFTTAWVWMGEWGSWRAAVTAYLFPERHLDPVLLAPRTDPPATPLDTLLAGIRGSGPFSAAQAVKEAAKYLTTKSLNGFSYLNPKRSDSDQSARQALLSARQEPERKEIAWAVPLLLAQRLQSAGDFAAALDWYWAVYPYDVNSPTSIYDGIHKETPTPANLSFPPNWTAALDPFELVKPRGSTPSDVKNVRPMPYTRYTLLSIIRCHIEYADAEFARETDEAIANARTLYVTAKRLLGAAVLRPVKPSNPGEPPLAIPELAALGARADVQLAKLRQGRNIAGMPRTRGLATTLTVRQPTPFRFKVLLERARQLIGQAAQMEAGYLAALEKYDEKSLRIFDALKGIDLSAAQVTLAASRVREASDAAAAAVAQRTKANAMVTTYLSAISAAPNRYEQELLREFDKMGAGAFVDAALGSFAGAAGGIVADNPIAIVGAVLGFGRAAQDQELQAKLEANRVMATVEQRRTEWRIQQAIATQESLVAGAQVQVARDQEDIATQEQAIARLQYDQAAATLTFLNNQFTNPDLYLWMSRTLGGVYRYFLQQATATARLAEAQLAFERAEPQQNLVRNDYWQTPTQQTTNTTQVDRRGLTGAEQLAADLDSLDQYAFKSERRLLNLSQTFSLAQLLPVEFLEFRRTGTLPFATPTSLFDQDLPGQYLRRIRQVRLSLIALVPPDRGIRATLSSNGISRVTTGRNGAFQDVTVRHDPSVVALTSPLNASGVFELDAQADMLLPFEGSGVDTTWELRLPPAANPLDFSAIADVLFTIEYTALHDDVYRSQQIARLNVHRERSADRVFSLARDFPDQWYDLNNAIDPKNRSVTITLREGDFPATIDNLATAGVAVRLSSDQPVPNTTLSLRHGIAGGTATTADGIASTRRGNAADWATLYGANPAGDWQLTFGADAVSLFASGRLDDVQLAITWAGKAPLWTS